MCLFRGLFMQTQFQLSIYIHTYTNETQSPANLQDLGLTPYFGWFMLLIIMSAKVGIKFCKAYRMLGLLRHTFSKSLSISTKKLLYVSLVRSQLIYGSPIWRPFLIKDIKLIEQIQHRATKFILNDFHSDYYNCLIKLQFCLLCICSNYTM